MTATATVLSLIPSTRAVVSGTKTTLFDAAAALGTGRITVALRDNGEKINGTLVFIGGDVGEVGSTVNAVNARNKAKYGTHLILGTVDVVVQETEGDPMVAISDVNADIDVDLNTKAALFTVADTSTVSAQTVTVVKSKDGTVVAADVTVAAAEILIAKAKAGKQAALKIASSTDLLIAEAVEA